MVLPKAILLNQINGLNDKLGAEYKKVETIANNKGKIECKYGSNVNNAKSPLKNVVINKCLRFLKFHFSRLFVLNSLIFTNA